MTICNRYQRWVRVGVLALWIALHSVAAEGAEQGTAENRTDLNQQRLARGHHALGNWDFSSAKEEATAVIADDPSQEDAAQANTILLEATEGSRWGFGLLGLIGKANTKLAGILILSATLIIFALRKWRATHWIRHWRTKGKLFVDRINDSTALGIAGKVRASLFTSGIPQNGFASAYYVSDGFLAPADEMAQPGKLENLFEDAMDIDPIMPDSMISVSKLLSSFDRIRKRGAPLAQIDIVENGDDILLRFTFELEMRSVFTREFGFAKDLGAVALEQFIDDCAYAFKRMVKSNNPESRECWAALPAIRLGLRTLVGDPYVTSSGNVERALKIFSSASAVHKTNLDLLLLEAIALGLRSDNEQALHLLKNVRSDIGSFRSLFYEGLEVEITDYNVAISSLRQYRLEALHQAQSLLETQVVKLKAQKGERHREVFLMSKAALASVKAHLLIYAVPKDPTQITPEIMDKADALKGEALQIAQEVIGEIAASSFGKARQAKWVSNNAIGNAHLNFARYCLEKCPDVAQKARYRDELLEAEKIFETCRQYTAPTVELYSNLAAVKLFLKEYDRCQKYCEAAIRCDPTYEYAYYRMAASYDAQDKWEDVLAVAARFGRQPNISGFKDYVAKAREKTKRSEPATNA